MDKITAAEIRGYKNNFMQVANEHMCYLGTRFSLDENNRDAVSKIFDYLMRIENPDIDPYKGIILIGNIGTGKSTLMQIFAEFIRQFDFGKHSWKVVPTATVVEIYSTTGNLDKFTYNKSGFSGKPFLVCFDELGREPLSANYMGTKTNVMMSILQVRYQLWQQDGLRTFATSNFDIPEFVDFYGEYVADRMKEMFNIIYIGGESRR